MAGIQVRLSPDARRLEAFLPATAMQMPRGLLLRQILEACQGLEIEAPLTLGALEESLRECVYGAWVPVLAAMPPQPPVDGRVELLVAAPVLSSGLRGARRHEIIRAGSALARLVEGAPGQPGRDLLGRAIPPRPPRPPRAPMGENTRLSADGTHLLAACDGQVVMRGMQVHVVPMRLHEGGLAGAGSVLESETGIVVAGSVEDGARIDAEGDVLIDGHVREARILSAAGSVTVRGSVSGSVEQPSVIDAGLDVVCRSLLHAEVRAGGDIVLQSEAHSSSLEAGGHIYLPDTIDRALFEVDLRVGGGVVPVVDAEAPAIALPGDWEEVKGMAALEALMARHGAPPRTFHPCVVEQLSASGARCQVAAALWGDGLTRGTIMQLKLEMPGRQDHLLIIARVERVIGPRVVALSFLQLAMRDRERLHMLGLELMRGRTGAWVAHRARRA
jgi:hypothetical protein